MDPTTSLDPTTITNSLMQSLAIPLLLGTIASIVLVAVWIVAKVIGAVQMHRAYGDLREIRRLLTELNHHDQLRFEREQSPAKPVTPSPPPTPSDMPQ